MSYWRSAAAQMLKWMGYGTVAATIGAFALGESTTLAQRGRNRGGGGGGGGSGVRVQGGGNAQIRVPNTGAQVRTPAAGGQVTVPGAGGQVRVPGAGADIRVPGAGGQVRVPGTGGDVRVPGTGADVRVPGADGQVRVPGAGADVRLPSAGGEIRVPGGEARTALRPDLDAGLRGGAQLDGSVTSRLPAGVRIDSSVRTGANQRFSPNWANLSRTQRQQMDQFRTSLSTAMRGTAVVDGAARTDANLATNAWLSSNPNRIQYWNTWGTNARNSFRFGTTPYFSYNWWNGRNLIGLGLGGYGWGYGPGFGGWWGYQPWLVNQPWWYWYSRPLWGSLTGWLHGYGWSSPYYYDYGPGGNVVYTGGQVYVNSQPVGTAADYSLSAAELAAVDPAQIRATAPEDWMPLGTFTLSTAEDETDPARVVQLAVNKQGLISGTSYNKRTDKTYTVQGRVDKDTQRVAFTIGNATDIVMETGLFNLTQEETPVLAHLGPTKTATYLLARLPEPQHAAEEEAPHTAARPTLP